MPPSRGVRRFSPWHSGSRHTGCRGRSVEPLYHSAIGRFSWRRSGWVYERAFTYVNGGRSCFDMLRRGSLQYMQAISLSPPLARRRRRRGSTTLATANWFSGLPLSRGPLRLTSRQRAIVAPASRRLRCGGKKAVLPSLRVLRAHWRVPILACPISVTFACLMTASRWFQRLRRTQTAVDGEAPSRALSSSCTTAAAAASRP